MRHTVTVIETRLEDVSQLRVSVWYMLPSIAGLVIVFHWRIAAGASVICVRARRRRQQCIIMAVVAEVDGSRFQRLNNITKC